MKFEMLDVVSATVDSPAFGIKAGDVGTIVEVYGDGEYEVEFCNEKGETMAAFAMQEQQLRHAQLLKQAA